MTTLRWKIYKALCWIAWQICPEKDRAALGVIWDSGIQKWRELGLIREGE